MARMKDPVSGLTPMQEAFCVEFVRSPGVCATEAYRKVYDVRNSTAKSVWNMAYKLVKRPNVAARIVELRANAVRKQELSIDMVLEVRCIAFVNSRTLFDAEGNLLPVSEIPDATWRAVASLQVLADGSVKVKLFDKMQALERLIRILGIFEKDHAQKRSALDELPLEQQHELRDFLDELARDRESGRTVTTTPGSDTH